MISECAPQSLEEIKIIKEIDLLRVTEGVSIHKYSLQIIRVVEVIGIIGILSFSYFVPISIKSISACASCSNNLAFMMDGGGSWTNMTPASSPPRRNHSPLLYDNESDRIILFSGYVEYAPSDRFHNDTWTYNFNTNTWTNMSPSTMPPGRGSHALAYDAESDRIILFGGAKTGQGLTLVTRQETWVYNLNTNTWTNMSPSVMPSGRVEASIAYDIESDHIILFGGYLDGGVYNDETWVYNFNNNTWTNMNPVTHPSPRQSAPMAYDVESDRAIIMGGWLDATFFAETWAYDFNSNTWTQMSPTPHPQARSYGLSYDVEADRIISFGGSRDRAETQMTSDTWAYDFNQDTWTNMNAATHPSARNRAFMTYDIESDRSILFGGKGSEGWSMVFNDTWAYDYPSDFTPIDFFPILLITGICIVAIVVVVAIVWFIKRRS